MKKVLFLAIVGILVTSIIGCNINQKERSTVSNDESKNTNVDVSKNSGEKPNEDFSKSIGSSEPIDEEIALSETSNINIEICAGEISIKSYVGENVKISGKLSEKSKGIDINKNDNKIEILEKGYTSIGSIGNNENNNTKIDILVPSKFEDDFTFKQGAGKSNIEGIRVKNIDITGSVGAVKCENIKFDKLNLNSSVGKVDLDLNDKCGDIQIDGGVGETNIKMAEVGGNLKYKGDVGNCNITIPKNAPVKFITQKGIGKCEINATTSGEETYTFDLKASVGSISVRN